MTPRRRMLAFVSLIVFAGAAMTADAQTASGTEQSRLVAKPVIGPPITAPAQPLAGKPFSVSFKVTRSDTGATLSKGRMMCDPSVAGGKVIIQSTSFKGGTARVTLVVPTNAAGKLLKVTVTITAGGQSTTKLASFRVRQSAAKPSVSIDDVSAMEGNSSTTMSFPVTLSAASSQTVSVNFATTDGTATASGDYAATSGTLRFAPGETSKAVQIAINGDTIYEPDETFTVALSNPVNATIAVGTATGTIENDDPLVRPGHYNGTNSMLTLFAFDVTPAGNGVTHLVTGQINQSCNGDVTISQGALDYGDFTIPVGSDGSFTSDETYKGTVSDGTTTTETSTHVLITGHFTGDTASGTLIKTIAFTLAGTGYSCTSGNQTWTATRTG